MLSTKALLLSTASVLLLATPGFASAQIIPAAPAKPGIENTEGQVYEYVEQVPHLPGGGGNRAIVEAIQKHVYYPKAALQQALEGIVMVYFVVNKNGDVRQERIVRKIGGGCDEVVLTAVRQLPRFTPGTQHGKPVAVAFTVPITFKMEDSKADLLDTLKRVYPLVNLMPHLPGDERPTAIAQTVQRALVMPAEVASDSLVRKVFVGFIVGPSGVIRDVKIIRGLSPSCNAAALAAVRTLPRFVGGKLNGLPASVSMTVPVLFGRLPPKP